MQTVQAVGGQGSQVKQPFGRGALPWSVWLHRNQVYSRVFLDVFGWGGGAVVFARNKFERVEKAIDIGGWLLIGVASPVLMDKVVNQWYCQKLKQQFPAFIGSLAHKASPLALPFEYLDKAGIAQRVAKLSLDKEALKKLKGYGLKSYQTLLDPKFRQKVLWGKILILGIDLIIMASKGQICFWGKNIITRIWSGQKGFSGEFNYAKKQYREEKTKGYELTKHWRAIASLGIGYGGALLLPTMMWKLLNKNVMANAKGAAGALKRFIPILNYTDVVFMSRWVMLWHSIFNWNLPAYLSSRDSHELRENLIRTNFADFFCYVGDGVMAGYFAKWFQKNAKAKLETPLFKQNTKGFWFEKLPQAIPLHRVYGLVGKDSAAFKWARLNFSFSLGLSAVILSGMIPVFNNWFTKTKVLEEQKQMQPKAIQPQPVPIFTPPANTPWVPRQATA